MKEQKDSSTQQSKSWVRGLAIVVCDMVMEAQMNVMVLLVMSEKPRVRPSRFAKEEVMHEIFDRVGCSSNLTSFRAWRSEQREPGIM